MVTSINYDPHPRSYLAFLSYFLADFFLKLEGRNVGAKNCQFLNKQTKQDKMKDGKLVNLKENLTKIFFAFELQNAFVSRL